MNVMITNIDVVMDNVYRKGFITMGLQLLIVLIILTNIILNIKVLRACQLYDGPSFGCEDLAIRRVSYSNFHLAPRYLQNRTIYSTKDRFIHENCWSAFKCLLNSTDIKYNMLCNKFCEFNECKIIIQANCPYILYYPNIPLLFDDIYFAFRKNDLQYLTNCLAEILYLCYKKAQYNDFFYR